MFTFTSLSSSLRSSAMRSRTGATAWHGPHHSAQKSTSTGVSLASTSSSKVVVFTSTAIKVLSFASCGGLLYPPTPVLTLLSRRDFPPVREMARDRLEAEPLVEPHRRRAADRVHERRLRAALARRAESGEAH